MIDHFVLITTWPTSVILLCLVCSHFDLLLIALFCATIRRYFVSLWRFLFLSYVQVFLCEISLVCCLKCAYGCFTSHFCFQLIFVLLNLVLSVLFTGAVISLPPCFFMLSSNRCIDILTLSSMLEIPLPSFLDTYSMSTSSIWDVMPYASSWFFLFFFRPL